MKIIIVGGGQVGSYLARLLITNGHSIKLVDHREKVIQKLKKELPEEYLIFGDGVDPEVLLAAGIDTADVVAAVSGVDEINLVVSTLAKMEFGVARVVARVNNPKNAWVFDGGMGVDVCVNQADLIAHLVVEEMNIKDMITLLKLGSDNFSIIQMKVAEKAIATNQMVRDLSIPKNMVLIAITRNGSLLIPKGDTQIKVNDEIIALADEESRQVIGTLFGQV